MDYKTIIANLTESKFLISMTPIEKVVVSAVFSFAITFSIISTPFFHNRFVHTATR